MAGNTEFTFGFELLQKLTDNDICKKEDVIILFVHWYIIKCGFKCIGLGDSKTFDASEKGSEALPENWNKRPNYALRYLKDGKLFILHAVKSDDDLLINLLRVEDNTVANVQIPITQTVHELHGPLEVLIPQYQSISQTIRNDLLEPVISTGNVHISTQTTANSQQEREPRQVEPDPDPARGYGPFRHSDPSRAWNPEATSVGAADLDPFALENTGRSGSGTGIGGGGGMLFDPFSRRTPSSISDPRGIGGLGVPGRLPPGSVPPGARFFPFGPPTDFVPPRRNNPDNDELPPPGYDDMFM